MSQSAHVHGSLRTLLRVEGLAMFAASIALYAHSGASWSEFAALFFVPDLSFAGYLAGARFGAMAYNTMHSEVGPLLLGASAALGIAPAAALPVAMIWFAHVGIDRALGYGLKYASSFGETHLGLIGKAAQAARTSLEVD